MELRVLWLPIAVVFVAAWLVRGARREVKNRHGRPQYIESEGLVQGRAARVLELVPEVVGAPQLEERRVRGGPGAWVGRVVSFGRMRTDFAQSWTRHEQSALVEE